MSTIKTTNIQHPSAPNPAIVLDADGNVAIVNGGSVGFETSFFLMGA
jgi:hypothetical protein